MARTEISLATRAAIITLKSPVGGKTSQQISNLTGVSISQINRIWAKACQRGFDPNSYSLNLENAWLEDAPRTGRPSGGLPRSRSGT